MSGSSAPRSRGARGHAHAVLGAALAGAWLAASGCGAEGGPTIAVSAARVALEPVNRQSALVSFQTARAVRPRVSVVGPSGTWTVPESGTLTASPGTSHEVLLLGLAPETRYELVLAGEGVVPDRSLSFTTEPLPAGFPTLDVRVSQPERMEPGVTLVGLSGLDPGWIAAYDAAGVPVWYHRPEPPVIVTHVQRLASGNIAYVAGTEWERIVEIDLRGRLVREYAAAALGLEMLHHDFDVLPDGHLLAQTSELVPVSGFPPGDPPGPNTLELVADSLVELDGAGHVARRWAMLDVLAPHRIRLDALFPYWNHWYPGSSLVRGWCHLNNVTYVPKRDSVLLSALDQRMVFEMGLADGKLRWVLGSDDPRTHEDDDWPFLALEPGGRLPARQHDVEELPDGDILVYDNAIDTLRSRCVRYRIDPEHRTARQVWDFIDPDLHPPAFSLVAGDCDGLGNGNILVFDPLAVGLRTRIAELDPRDDSKVFEAFTAPTVGGFDAERIRSLYPD